jgi:hypothetical protein
MSTKRATNLEIQHPYVCMYVCMYACMYACMYVCMYVYMNKDKNYDNNKIYKYKIIIIIRYKRIFSVCINKNMYFHTKCTLAKRT